MAGAGRAQTQLESYEGFARRILFIITDDDPGPGPVAISPAIIALYSLFITLLVTDFTVGEF